MQTHCPSAKRVESGTVTVALPAVMLPVVKPKSIASTVTGNPPVEGTRGTRATDGTPAAVPLVPSTGGLPVTVDASDFGLATGHTTAGIATFTLPDSTLFALGQWVCIGGAGNSAKTASLFAQVIAAPTATTITLSTASLGTLTNAPIGNTNLTGGAYWPPNTPPTGAFPYNTAGLASPFNPIEGLTRAVSVTGVASGTGGTFILRGYGIYGFAVSENIVATAGETTVI